MRATVHVDGGARGNPGPAAAATKNVAEYGGLALGLERARALGARENARADALVNAALDSTTG